MKQLLGILTALALLCGILPARAERYEGATEIVLADEGVTVNGQPASPDSSSAVYTANDIVFYPAGQDFTYGEGSASEAHTQQEADAHTVVHITQPGTYVLSGSLSAGQVAVDVENGREDPEAVVTLVLNGVDITCSAAPAVIFYDVYECGSTDTETASHLVDTSAAGANVIIADGTVNTISGSHVARIYDPATVELSEDGTEVAAAEKLHKYDGAFYSRRSMNVSGGPEGTGELHITADNEGLDSELHLTINGGRISIVSGNDGINTNEDNVSVTTINGGQLSITVSGATGEGDGIDSNGWLVINGGRINAAGCSFSGDAGIDSDLGIYLNGGELCASGNMFDHVAGGGAARAVFSFDGRVPGGSTLTLRNKAGDSVAEWSPVNDFSCLVVSGEALVPGSYTLWQDDVQLAYTGSTVRSFGGANRPGMPGGMEMPEGFDFSQMTPPEGFEAPGGGMPPAMPEGMTPPEMPEGMEQHGGQARGAEGGRGGGGRRGSDSAQQGGSQQTLFLLTEEGGSFSGITARTE